MQPNYDNKSSDNLLKTLLNILIVQHINVAHDAMNTPLAINLWRPNDAYFGQ